MLCRKHSIRTCLLRLLWNMGARRYVFLSVLTYLTPQRERLSLDLRDSLLRTEDISCTSTQQQFPIPKRKSSFTLTIRPHFPRMKENLLFYFLFFLFTFFFYLPSGHTPEIRQFPVCLALPFALFVQTSPAASTRKQLSF